MQREHILKTEYLKRKEKNPRYSLRSYARDLGVSHTLVSRVFSGTRNISVKQAMKIALALQLSSKGTQQFINQTLSPNSHVLKKSDYHNPEIELEKVFGKWFHTAILESTKLKKFDGNPITIGKRLGISSIEARDAIDRLKVLGLLEGEGTNLKMANKMLRFRSQESLEAVRAFYSAMLLMANEELKRKSNVSFKSRYIGGGTAAVKLEKIPKAIERLKEMQDEFLKEFASEDADQIYQLGLQFFSLTDRKEGNKI